MKKIFLVDKTDRKQINMQKKKITYDFFFFWPIGTKYLLLSVRDNMASGPMELTFL